ncbi:GNAT family N-acetyltransferase [Actinopolymorpha sp. B9G3]|uniref:GNAT family N-acetyltransferase n=1 Tax=Actinopolymorpha sp. B9G3 TaxID=3158970 RepID=UPI0032D99B56
MGVWRTARGNDTGVEIHPVTPERWDDLVELFERKGPRGGTPIPGSCWCSCWRERQGVRALNKAAFKAAVDDGRVPGMIAYAEGRPVGWVAVAPREDHSGLERSRWYGPCPGDRGVFAVTCFYVDRALRGTGVSSALLDAAIEYARASGATAVDAFPKVDVAQHALTDRRAEENASWMGRRQSFEVRGFVTIRATGKRAVMRLSFHPEP